MSAKLSIKFQISVTFLCVLSSLNSISGKSGWVYKNKVEVPICYNPNNNLGCCVPMKECAAFNYVLRHNLRESYKFFWASRCERESGNPPFICCTNDIKFRDQKTEKCENERIIFPDELERVKKGIGANKNVSISERMESSTTTESTTININETTESAESTTSIESTETTESTENAQIQNNETNRFPRPPKCGGIIVSNKIYGGHDADLSEFSWMVILEFRNQTTGKLLMDCSGSLINDQYVLTAAHCVQGEILRIIGKLESVRIGEHDTEKEIDCNETGCQQSYQRIAVESIIPHPNFELKSYLGTRNQNDIALLRLKKTVKFNEILQPICLPNVENIEVLEESTIFTVAGWGHNGTMIRTAIKQKLELPLVKHEKCRAIYGKNFYLADEQLCAGGRFREDSCNGDSGGPLMRICKDFWVLEGIVSFGLKCGLEQPGVYTNVRHYLKWINENVQN